MKINDSFVLRDIYNKYILMPIVSNSVSNDPILLNEVAVDIWKTASECEDEDELLENMIRLYDLDKLSPESISIKKFILDMVEMGLIIKHSYRT